MTADNMLNMVDATATRSTTIAACPAERVGRTTVNSLPTLLALNRTVGIVLISILFFGLGEQLWSPFLRPTWEPKRARPARSWSAASALLRSSRLACTHACATCSKLPAMSEVGSSQRVWVIAAH